MRSRERCAALHGRWPFNAESSADSLSTSPPLLWALLPPPPPLLLPALPLDGSSDCSNSWQ
eukprot:2637823-Pleurochrysis_carterae.AAC.2